MIGTTRLGGKGLLISESLLSFVMIIDQTAKRYQKQDKKIEKANRFWVYFGSKIVI